MRLPTSRPLGSDWQTSSPRPTEPLTSPDLSCLFCFCFFSNNSSSEASASLLPSSVSSFHSHRSHLPAEHSHARVRARVPACVSSVGAGCHCLRSLPTLFEHFGMKVAELLRCLCCTLSPTRHSFLPLWSASFIPHTHTHTRTPSFIFLLVFLDKTFYLCWLFLFHQIQMCSCLGAEWTG